MRLFSLQGVREDGQTDVLGVFEDGHDTGPPIAAFIEQLPAGVYQTITSTEHVLRRCEPVDLEAVIQSISPTATAMAAAITEEQVRPYASEMIASILATAPKEVLDDIWGLVCRIREAISLPDAPSEH